MTSSPASNTQDVIVSLCRRAKSLHEAVVGHFHSNCSKFCSNLSVAAMQPRGYSQTREPQAAFASIAHSSSTTQLQQPPAQPAVSGRISKDQVGRASWTFLHALAAQYPDKPTRQQMRDVTNLVDILTRMYPCAECAKHFKEIVKASPVRSGSRRELQLWMCEAHNSVNRSIGKPTFNCALVEARWGALDCEEEARCSLAVGGRR